ncbi:MAG: PEP-CTERM sorting domain-containing protein [Desulfobacterales bacterium]|nr:PEP-CTERM sorting domain-containing protein [Desulfobacterales bacterium]
MVSGVSPATAITINPVFENGPQDLLFLATNQWHELGNAFPPDEIITSNSASTDDTACFDGSDSQVDQNFRVSILNNSNLWWTDLHYVADTTTSITNFDGWIGNAGVNDLSYAFKIDDIGINRPLVFESINANLVFEPGERWEFIIQDYIDLLGALPAHAFGSPGIASLSPVGVFSSGSIIARPIPEPSTMLLLGFGLIGFAGFGRKKFKK